ncbi:DUF485 domain-containing protein [Macromonas nakdongensis]|uniref:DUF485 domain-containing protein n=1 Tax=Macromonas nakdongensis TaxID=1843082 RepID=UPI000C33B1FA|nr:DUF485 domain-containing protein [Macromonas nakdongensis]
MNHTQNEKIRSHPKFQQLCQERSRYSWVLSLMVLVPFYTFVALVSFKPDLFSAKFMGSPVITVGWPIATALVIGAWLLTGVYIRRSNSRF